MLLQFNVLLNIIRAVVTTFGLPDLDEVVEEEEVTDDDLGNNLMSHDEYMMTFWGV